MRGFGRANPCQLGKTIAGTDACLGEIVVVSILFLPANGLPLDTCTFSWSVACQKLMKHSKTTSQNTLSIKFQINVFIAR
jgi:hypothetical protein